MKRISATVHVDRFDDLLMVAGKNNSLVIDPLAVGDDSTVEVVIVGPDDVVSKLEQSISRLQHILGAPVVLEIS